MHGSQMHCRTTGLCGRFDVVNCTIIVEDPAALCRIVRALLMCFVFEVYALRALFVFRREFINCFVQQVGDTESPTGVASASKWEVLEAPHNFM